MKPYSIQLRNQLYFQLLFLADALWNENFQKRTKLHVKNRAILKKMTKLMEQLLSQEPQEK